MTEKYSFFDSIFNENGLPDREYNAQEFTDYFEKLITTGVMKGDGQELKVTANGSNMISTIGSGTAYVVGRQYINTAALNHTHDTETLGKDRIDRIVVRLDLNTEARYVKSFIKKGVASANPVPPALTRNATVYEISLAQVKVIGGQTYINAANVTDERGKDDICPWAGSKILPNFNDDALEDLINKVDGKADKAFLTPLKLPLTSGITGSVTIQKNDMNIVVFSAKIKTSTGGPYGTVTTLPAGYRPQNKIVIIVNLEGRNTTMHAHALELLPDGEVIFKGNSNTSGGFPVNVFFQGEAMYKSYSQEA